MTRIGTLQGTYLGIYQAKVCEYWTAKPERVNCKFCSVGLNLGVDDANEKSVDEVMEVIRAARDESGITYVDFNTGHYEGDTYLDILEPYIVRIKRELRLLVALQTPPPQTEDLVPVFRRLYEACMERGLPIGCAPNVHVSLVLLPEECRSLSSRRFPLQTLKLKAMAKVFARRFDKRLAALPGGQAGP